MLREIRIRNFAVIDSVTASFSPGLNVLTGETGAGKSMVIDAILLVRGARAQTDVIRGDSETATVEAVFEGERAQIEACIEWNASRQPHAKVDRADVAWEAPTGEFTGFEVRH